MVKERVRWKGICGKGTRCMENTMMVEGWGWLEFENIDWTGKYIALPCIFGALPIVASLLKSWFRP